MEFLLNLKASYKLFKYKLILSLQRPYKVNTIIILL